MLPRVTQNARWMLSCPELVRVNVKPFGCCDCLRTQVRLLNDAFTACLRGAFSQNAV
jgi:hypothetical protein